MPPGPRAWPWLAAAALYTLTAIGLLWPLLRQAGSRVVLPGDDALLNSWIPWWNSQAVPLTQAWWNAPVFYPASGAFAFSEVLLGQLPITAPVLWLTGNPVLAHNLALFVSFPLCALAAHALAYQLTRRHDAALLTGLAFGFGAFRANNIGHVQMLSYYWAPVALMCLHRSLEVARPVRWLAAAAVACTMQVLCNGYALFQLPILIAAWVVWFPRTMRQRIGAAAALAAGLLAVVPLLLGYRRIHTHYGMTRAHDALGPLSADVADLFRAHPWNIMLGRVIPGEATSWFPGITVAGLLIVALVIAIRNRVPVASHRPWYRQALLGLAVLTGTAALSTVLVGPWAVGPLTVSQLHKPLSLAIVAATAYLATGPRARRLWTSRSTVGFYLLSSVMFFVLSFGPEPRLLGTPVFYRAPYALMRSLPGYDSIRAPDRMALLATLCLLVVMAITYARWAPVLRNRRGWVAAVLCCGVVLDGWFRFGVRPVPMPGPSLDWGAAQAVVELPITPESDVPAMYRSIAYGRPSINGSSGYFPVFYYVMRDALAEGDMSVLDGLGVKGPIGVVIARQAAEHDALARAVASVEGATRLQQSDAWTVYQLPLRPVSRPQLGESLPVTQVTGTPAGDHVSDVLAELATPSPVSAVRLHAHRIWANVPRELVIETSPDGASWTPAWQGRSAPLVMRGLLENQPVAPIVFAFEQPQTARFVRIRPLVAEKDRYLTTDGLSVH